MLRVVPPYAAVLAVLFVVLSARVIAARTRLRVGIGAGGDSQLERRIRAHGNFAEYAPLGLLLLAMADLAAAPAVALHALCICLVAGRACHAWALSRPVESGPFRIIGMAATFTSLLGAALLAVW